MYLRGDDDIFGRPLDMLDCVYRRVRGETLIAFRGQSGNGEGRHGRRDFGDCPRLAVQVEVCLRRSKNRCCNE